MSAIPQLVSAPLNPVPIAEHFRRTHPGTAMKMSQGALTTCMENLEIPGRI